MQNICACARTSASARQCLRTSPVSASFPCARFESTWLRSYPQRLPIVLSLFAVETTRVCQTIACLAGNCPWLRRRRCLPGGTAWLPNEKQLLWGCWGRLLGGSSWAAAGRELGGNSAVYGRELGGTGRSPCQLGISWATAGGSWAVTGGSWAIAWAAGEHPNGPWVIPGRQLGGSWEVAGR